MTALSPETILLRLVLATVLGAVIGWEREWERKPAGLRTNVLVSLGASTFMILGFQILAVGTTDFAGVLSRVLAAVISGIGFLGAGTILKGPGLPHVEGLTTAAGLWVVAGIGAATAIGSYTVAVTATALTFIVLRSLSIVDQLIYNYRRQKKRGEPESCDPD